MDAIIQLAERLGKAIADSPAATKLQEARKAMAGEADLTKTLDEYQKQSQKVAMLESENKPVEVADKHALRDLQDKLVSADAFKKFTAAQVDYVDLMRKVNEALQSQLSQIEGD